MPKPSKECRTRAQKHLEKHFPEMASVKPRVSSTNRGGQARHRFTYRKALSSPNGEKFQQIVHLTTNEEGRVLKVAVSR
ncbi:MAG: hypothetical protein GTO63_26440 [Anaerolineae bacterium]|nr:hypothetical protein [Anaerolineae bacterium]NIN98275.1 hypothetical protein [Anaerolineae bacterium]NIQ81204.1 hypothetical protein [Anaerolineae bacterium]